MSEHPNGNGNGNRNSHHNGNGNGHSHGNGNGHGTSQGVYLPKDRFSAVELTKPRLFPTKREVIKKTGIAKNVFFFFLMGAVSAAYLAVPQESVRDTRALIVPSRRVDFTSPRDGLVMRAFVKEGDAVEEGRTLVIIASPEDALLLNQARLESQALAREISAEKDEARVLSLKLEEAKKLHAMGSVKSDAVDEARLRFLSKKKRIGALRMRLFLSSVRLQELTQRMGLGQIRAPFTGKVISDIGVKENVFVKAGDFLFTLASGDSLVEVLLKESDYARIEPGARARIKFYAFPERTYEGWVAGFKHFAEPLPKSGIAKYAVKALVKLHSFPPRVQNGMSAKVTLEAKSESLLRRFYREMF